MLRSFLILLLAAWLSPPAWSSGPAAPPQEAAQLTQSPESEKLRSPVPQETELPATSPHRAEIRPEKAPAGNEAGAEADLLGPVHRAYLVIDASGSMASRAGEVTKLELARSTLQELQVQWGPGAEVGLIAFGHRGAGCTDIETLVPLGSRETDRIERALASLAPRGSTPLAAAIRYAAEELGNAGKEIRIVVVSDWFDTCREDPCGVVSELAAEGVDLTLFVIGHNVFRNSRAQEQLRCLAERSGGTYEPAWDTRSLGRALERSLRQATGRAPKTEPPEPPRQLPSELRLADQGLVLQWAQVQAPVHSVLLGSPEGESGRRSNETLREVQLANDFWITTTEITQHDWQLVMQTTPSYASDCPFCPVERVSWLETMTFANRLSELAGLEPCYALEGCEGSIGSGCFSGQPSCDSNFHCSSIKRVARSCNGYRLPTEDEWEYAARAGTTSAFWSGDALSPAEANCVFDGTDPSDQRTTQVATLAANPWGLFDVHGNVWEWLDRQNASAEKPPREMTARERNHLHRMIFLGRHRPTADEGSGEGSSAGVRGGGFADPPEVCRSAHRASRKSNERFHDVGFRLVQEIH